MKKISLQTKLEECSVPQRYIDAIKRGSKDIGTIYDLVSLTRCEFLRIRSIGKRCFAFWDDFLEHYGLHFGMAVDEIRQYESEETSNCGTESSVDWEQRRYEIAKTMLPIIYANNKINEDEECFTLQEYVDGAVNIADTLIKELKKSHE